MISANVIANLRRVEIFAGLSDEELVKLAEICHVLRVNAGHKIFKEGDDGSELYILHEGCVKVALNTRASDGTFEPTTINMLYSGQSFGEMSLLGGATRSATISAADKCTLLMLHKAEFDRLCELNPHIGFVVMRNLASDLAYKLRSSNLLLRGNIRWQHGELGKK